MKYRYFFIIILSLYCIQSQAQIEGNHKVGIAGGPLIEANLTQFIITGTTQLKSQPDMGFTGGGFLQIGLSKEFAIQGELLFHYKNSHVGIQANDRIRYWGLEIPLYALYIHNLKGGHYLHMGGGPYAEFGLSADALSEGEITSLYHPNNNKEIQAMHGSNTGFGVIFGYEMPCRIQINLSYKISIANLLDANSNEASFFPMAINLGVAYRFGTKQ